MSANIPFEIQEEIIKRVLPVKSLVRFRSVSKQWKSLIHSSEFITHHSVNQAQPHHVLVRYRLTSEDKYVSIVDDDSFPHHKFSPIVSQTHKLLSRVLTNSCSHGLVCLYGIDSYIPKATKLVVFWNPSIRKSIGIPIPYGLDAVGVGVCPKTNDPKIVAKATIKSPPGSDSKAEVYTLSSGAWRSISMNLRLPLHSLKLINNPVVIDGVIYWIAFDSISRHQYSIVSFDLTSEEFGEVDLPDSLAYSRNSISKLNDSLVVLNYYEGFRFCDVWMMIKTGDPKSWFTKLYTLSFKRTVNTVHHNVIGFRKNGQAMAEHLRVTNGVAVITLEVYDSSSEHNNDLEIDVAYSSEFMMTFYTESLLPLNHSDSVVQ